MLLVSKVYARSRKQPEDFGYLHIAMKFQNDPVDVIIISKENKRRSRKPLLFFCQDNLPQPLIRYDANGLHPVLPFDEQPFLDAFHIAIAAAPFIPVIADATTLAENATYYKDEKTKLPPRQYSERNFLDYHVARNNFIVKQLARERWADSRNIVVAGHADGATVAAKMAVNNHKISHLIYSGGNPYGKILSQLAENPEERQNVLAQWRNAANRDHAHATHPKPVYDFSQPQGQLLLGLGIPVLVCYDLWTHAAPYHDLLQVEAIRLQKENFRFITYTSMHDFAGVVGHGSDDYDQYRWEKRASDWRHWLSHA
ncbi:hypothetical protein FLLO111716_01820 [Flavobacterium longum]|uniref:hypothetical protein n=1 Tax=Flavobacterium longum TaxID=1299340 RepID=UPI0039EAD9F3